MFCIGLTGSIGSGKSTALNFFNKMGVNTIVADHIARDLTKSGQPAFLAIKKHFGLQVINEEGELQRTVLRTIIFQQVKERIWLEALLHPLIRQEIQQQVEQANHPYSVIEIPLLRNRNDYPYLNRVLLIIAEQATQINRIRQRDQCSAEEAKAMIAAQPSDQERQEIADDVIINQNLIKNFENAIKKIHQQYLLLAHKSS